MDTIPILGFAAYSGVGKTTLIEKLVVNLRRQGLRVAVIKHDGHDFEIDREGKDSWRYTQAGADITVVSSSGKTALIENRPVPLGQILSLIRGVDIVLVEGYKNEKFTQIGMARRGVSDSFPAPISRYAAVVTDIGELECPTPRFSFEDDGGVTRFILENMDSFTHFDSNGRIGHCP